GVPGEGRAQTLVDGAVGGRGEGHRARRGIVEVEGDALVGALCARGTRHGNAIAPGGRGAGVADGEGRGAGGRDRVGHEARRGARRITGGAERHIRREERGDGDVVYGGRGRADALRS